MKRLLIGALALSLLGSTAIAAAAQAAPSHGPDRYQQQSRYNQNSRQVKRWNKGQRVPTAYRNRGRQVDYRRHRLRQPPRGYQWVRDDNSNQYLMIALTTGLIAAIAAGN